MKITVTFKNPDAVDSALEFHKEHKGAIPAADAKVFKSLVKKFFAYEEYVDLEFDTEAKTVTVLKASN